MSVAPPQLSFLCNNLTLILHLPVFPTIPVVQYTGESVQGDWWWWRTGKPEKHRQTGVTKHNEPVWPCSIPIKKGLFSFVPHFEWDIKCVCVWVNLALDSDQVNYRDQTGRKINQPTEAFEVPPRHSHTIFTFFGTMSWNVGAALLLKLLFYFFSIKPQKLRDEESQCIALKMARTATFPPKIAQWSQWS